MLYTVITEQHQGLMHPFDEVCIDARLANTPKAAAAMVLAEWHRELFNSGLVSISDSGDMVLTVSEEDIEEIGSDVEEFTLEAFQETFGADDMNMRIRLIGVFAGESLVKPIETATNDDE